MKNRHIYNVNVQWTGNLGSGANGYNNYSRAHTIAIHGKPDISGSSDAVFRGDATKHNPEDLLVAALSSCHMLTYLHLCSAADIVVVDYVDNAIGIMMENAKGGSFQEVLLKPVVTINSGDIKKAESLHKQAHSLCFIANSVNFDVKCEPQIGFVDK